MNYHGHITRSQKLGTLEIGLLSNNHVMEELQSPLIILNTAMGILVI